MPKHSSSAVGYIMIVTWNVPYSPSSKLNMVFITQLYSSLLSDCMSYHWRCWYYLKKRDEKLTLARFNGWGNVSLIFYLSEWYLMSNHDVGKQCWSVCQQNSKQRYRFAYLSQHEDMPAFFIIIFFYDDDDENSILYLLLPCKCILQLCTVVINSKMYRVYNKPWRKLQVSCNKTS